MKRMCLAALVPVLLLAACGDTTTVVRSDGGGALSGMVVVGVGRVEVRPDTLVVALGVEATRPTAPEALEAMATAADAMIEAIRDAGVEPEDLQTTSLRVTEVRPPRRPGPIPFEDVGVAAASAPAAEGFVGQQRLRVRIRDLDSAGDVIQRAVDAAGEDARVFNMSLEVAEPDEAIARARQRAVEDALSRGEDLADTAGVDLGPPVAIEEISAPDPGAELLNIGIPAATGGVGGAGATADAAARIEPGVRRLEIRVQVRFDLES